MAAPEIPSEENKKREKIRREAICNSSSFKNLDPFEFGTIDHPRGKFYDIMQELITGLSEGEFTYNPRIREMWSAGRVKIPSLLGLETGYDAIGLMDRLFTEMGRIGDMIFMMKENEAYPDFVSPPFNMDPMARPIMIWHIADLIMSDIPIEKNIDKLCEQIFPTIFHFDTENNAWTFRKSPEEYHASAAKLENIKERLKAVFSAFKAFQEEQRRNPDLSAELNQFLEDPPKISLWKTMKKSFGMKRYR